MPPIFRTLFLISVPILGVAIFGSTWLQDFFSTSTIVPFWKAESTSPPQVKISQGLVVGKILDGGNYFPEPIEAFMGLPYAQAPIGDRRFRRAVQLPESNDTFNAHAYGPTSVTPCLPPPSQQNSK